MRDDAVFGNDDDTIADVVVGMVDIFRLTGWGDNDVVSDAGVFVHDRIFDAAIGADTNARTSIFLVVEY
jgi:hypothetical protein